MNLSIYRVLVDVEASPNTVGVSDGHAKASIVFVSPSEDRAGTATFAQGRLIHKGSPHKTSISVAGKCCWRDRRDGLNVRCSQIAVADHSRAEVRACAGQPVGDGQQADDGNDCRSEHFEVLL